MKPYITTCLLLAFFISCKKDEPSPTTESTPVESEMANEYAMLKPGNHWIYQWVNTNLLNAERDYLDKTDSIYVAEDTVIDGLTYHQLKGTWFGMPFKRILREEGAKLINDQGKIFLDLSVSKFELLRHQTNVSNPFIDSISWTMKKQDFLLNLPSGEFQSKYQYDGIFYLNPAMTIDSNYAIRHETEYYIKGVGVALYTSYYSAPINVNMELLRYNVQVE